MPPRNKHATNQTHVSAGIPNHHPRSPRSNPSYRAAEPRLSDFHPDNLVDRIRLVIVHIRHIHPHPLRQAKPKHSGLLTPYASNRDEGAMPCLASSSCALGRTAGHAFYMSFGRMDTDCTVASLVSYGQQAGRTACRYCLPAAAVDAPAMHPYSRPPASGLTADLPAYVTAITLRLAVYSCLVGDSTRNSAATRTIRGCPPVDTPELLEAVGRPRTTNQWQVSAVLRPYFAFRPFAVLSPGTSRIDRPRDETGSGPTCPIHLLLDHHGTDTHRQQLQASHFTGLR
ncbi:hypothetical protein CSOJ01_07835 [Colletotrichum sojae]|uniref:Uncharacterized protein n=1 Tax=Colletotrichum sojae TaxID=2175907 RepID=A0A8H6J7J7_9PEZI|nr:hypothetical protein CSOJ01_07835 [Colletotrichum sojae]